MSNNIFFVELRNPTEVKRDFLECLKSILESLERFEEFKSVRKKKIIKINGLKSIVKEINILISNLKKQFPETDVHILGNTVHEFDSLVKELKEKLPKTNIVTGKTKKKKQTEIIKSRKGPVSELDKLESELIDIEKKLENLE